mgnify:CR=1 FL=1|jgi:hypothetical protein
MKKKMMFLDVVSPCLLAVAHMYTHMMPNAQLALSMAHWRSIFRPYEFPLTVKRPKFVL